MLPDPDNCEPTRLPRHFGGVARSGRNSLVPLGRASGAVEGRDTQRSAKSALLSRDRCRSLVRAILDCHWRHWCRVRFITMSQTGVLIQLTGEYISVASYDRPRRGRSNERFCSWSSSVRRMPDRMKT